MRKQKRLAGKALQTLINLNRAVNNGDFEFMGSSFWKSEIKSTFNSGEGIASDFLDIRNIDSLNLDF